ncbi:CD63 antigen-like [Drosophila sulfurigaster albostrigata]|uniref:CD63 antigen-like n=1 Tax=Drosophila sulfurigaster albostrigata TaxID=89887 RepID=UPI002D21E8D5|nr:CD63 antigen-like [Drosophila sulfurigaster albostrigata]
MGCRSEIIKFLLLLFLLLCMICCSVLLVVAFPDVKDMNEFVDIKKYTPVGVVLITTIVMSIFVLLLSLLGCFGALRGNPSQLSVYSIIMMLFFVMQLFVAIYVWTNLNGIRDNLSIILKDVFDKHTTDNASKMIMDKMEQHLHCCGFENYTDYRPDPLPSACCGYENAVCKEDAAYKEGCQYTIINLWDSKTDSIKIGGLVVAALILLASVSSSYLAHKLRRSREIMQSD